jgi:glycosyltransferase involved in cell wall biosynthesis
VAEYLDEIDTLLPALLELNIRQARADGRPELAQALQELLNNVHLQMNGFIEHSVGKPASSAPQALRILFIGPANQPASLRQLLPAEALSAYGHEVTVATRFPADPQEHFDLVVAHNPHGDPHLLHGLATCAAAHIPIIVDLDADFEQMPITHPDYVTLRLGTPPRAKAFTAALLLADRVCVPNESLAASLRASGYQMEVIPEGWNQANPLWQKPPPRRHSLNLGWIGQPGQLEDMAMIRRYVTRIMREFSHVNLVIVGDVQVYQLFDSLPEARRLFLPPVNLEDYPYLYGQIDILLVPLRNTPFNNSQTDRQLMEAGVRQIPWVASPLPEYAAWGVGGLIANEPDDWHTYLRQLINDSTLRIKLGKAGRMKAEEREMDHLGKAWLEMITQCAYI